MASSIYNSYATVELEQDYPYPSNLAAGSFISVKLSGRDKYRLWKTQMLCLLKSHGMYGFINGTLIRPQMSVSGKEKVGDHHWLWTRSDSLVKGWILGSLSEKSALYVLDRLTQKLHQERDEDFSAKDVWDELHTIYGPAVPQRQTIYGPQPKQTVYVSPHLVVSPSQNIYAPPQGRTIDDPPHLSANAILDKRQEEEERVKIHQSLYQAILRGSWYEPERILSDGRVTLTDKITNNGNTALHVAVGTSKNRAFLQHLLGLTPQNTQLLDVRNSDGSTLLHVAAIVGNTQAADILVQRNRDLLLATDNEGHTPLLIALSNMHTHTGQHMLQQINTDIEKDTLFSGTSGDELLITVISSKDYRLAHDLLDRYQTLNSDALMMTIAQNFPCEHLTWADKVCSIGDKFFETAWDYSTGKCLPMGWCGLGLLVLIAYILFGIYYIIMFLPLIYKMLVWPLTKERARIYGDAIKLLSKACKVIINRIDPCSHHNYYTNPILEATRQNAYEVVQHIVSSFPDAIWSANEDGHNIIQYAVICRSEKVYNLLYQMSEHKNVYRTIKDTSGNNLLHLAARLAPTNRLNVISGAALQIQRELQWFKEVEGFVCPLNIKQKNSFDETPQMVFTREHKDLVADGEKWMKATAESFTITAALIITIVFAAAITVPGGNNQDTGIPIFTNNTAFTIFAISDAISLFGSATSLLMFLSILTARFAEEDFLFKLPTKLIIGLATLFISTTTMIVAFGATLYLVFGQRNSSILIPIGVLTCLPITSFVTLQFPLVIDLVRATYGRSIFGKKRNDSFY